MKSITLTKKQKERLLEMCKVLFPEYKYWNLHDGTCDLCTENTLDFAEKEKPEWNSWNRTHWFEFCSLLLTDKIFQKLNSWQDGNGSYQSFCALCIIERKLHPVDYLYEQFKKLK